MWHRSQAPAAGRRQWAQAVALFAILAGDGVAVRLLGGPLWLMLLYIALGLALGVGRVALARRPAPDAPAPAAEVSAEPPRRRALGYAYVAHQRGNAELAAQTRAIREWALAHGATLAAVVHDVEPELGGSGTRPALRGALERIAAHQADTLVIAQLAHLSPTVANLPPLLRWFTEPRRTLVAIDQRLDTATEAGRLAALALADVGGWEHERLSARTRRGLEAARERGPARGRASVADVPELRDRIRRMRAEGMTLQAIADVLNEEGVPTLRGGAKWRPSSVQRATGYRRPPSQAAGVELPGEPPPAG